MRIADMPLSETEQILQQMTDLLASRFHIHHTTFQFENVLCTIPHGCVITIGSSARHVFGCNLGSGTGTALDHHSWTARAADLFRQQAGHCIGWASGRERQDHSDCSGTLRPRIDAGHSNQSRDDEYGS